MPGATPDGRPALKERAGVVEALVDGRQVVLLRGTDLPPADDDLEDAFVLYPSYTHQDPGRYAERDLAYYHRSTTKPDGGVPIRAIADVVSEYRVSTNVLSALAPHYVYTESGLRDKYDLTDGDDVRALVVRVSRLADPRLVEERPDYRGCRSWISLAASVTVDPMAATPVLDDAAFAQRRAAVEHVLSASVSSHSVYSE